MTDEELKALVASLAVSQAKTDEKIKAINERLDQIETMLRGISDITTDFFYDESEEVDKFFFRYFADTHCLGSVNFETVQMNMSARNGETREKYDLMLINEDRHEVVVCEVGFKLDKADLQELDRKICSFKKLNPYYQNYKLYGALAAFHLSKEAKNEALERGFFVLQRSGKIVDTDCADNLLVM